MPPGGCPPASISVDVVCYWCKFLTRDFGVSCWPIVVHVLDVCDFVVQALDLFFWCLLQARAFRELLFTVYDIGVSLRCIWLAPGLGVSS